jgi:hypothetical protein
LVQIETAFRNPKERQPEALSRNEYTEVDGVFSARVRDAV